MVLKLYDNKTPITWPDGIVMTASEIAESDVYGIMSKEPFVIDVDERGVTSSFVPLSGLAEGMGIDEKDPEKTLAAVIAKIDENERKTREEIEKMNRFIDEAPKIYDHISTTQNAVGELGVMTATGFDSTAELGTLAATSMQSTAELGATVAALEARIAALEAAKA